MEFAALVAGVAERVVGEVGCEVTGLAYDSRRVRPGDAFLAIRGFHLDGHDFIADALARGAVACVVEDPTRLPAGVPAAVVRDGRRAAATIACRFFGDPTRHLTLVGVTGTNGKTTTAWLTRAALLASTATGLVGTVENVVGGRSRPVERTTPEAVDLQALFREMVDAGDGAAVMEVSSHALALHRVDGCHFDAAVFTNLTQDHLDFHGTLEAYREAKARLFAMLPPDARGAVLNADDPSWRAMAEVCRAPVLTYALEADADLRAEDVSLTPEGAVFAAVHGGERVPVRLHLPGRYNVANALAAMGAALVCGVPLERAAAALASVPGVPGRLERVSRSDSVTVLVDYAHTPDGLEKVLNAVREFTRGRLVVVFGCGGDRDRGKRPIMGEIAARLADRVYITSDNPRSEEPEAIVKEVEAGVRGVPGASWVVEVDRGRAIAAAIAEARPGDVVLIAGKGHETY
ncbi:MAG: UDP-N-acetylmuramoyl-L-alanyl-D-glutamate--2,6-diaminopimelate ligase, partial [Clostridia bacterium]|nr:UDP-N-acetylmuramoyl-L-alanyl-D-glutamate--2,6-diaminopimelate ligase [Clostridia bacterium]